MADKIYVYELVSVADMLALSEVLRRFGSALWRGSFSVEAARQYGFISAGQQTPAFGRLPEDEGAARKAADAALRELRELAARIIERYPGSKEPARAAKVLEASVYGLDFVSAVRTGAGKDERWHVRYWPTLRARRNERREALWGDGYVLAEVGGEGALTGLQIHLRPVLKAREEDGLHVPEAKGMLHLPDGKTLYVVYKADWSQGLYAPYYIRAAELSDRMQGRKGGALNELLVLAVAGINPEPQKRDKIVLTAAMLKAIAPFATEANSKKHLAYLNNTLQEFDMDKPLRAAHFLAQVMAETGSLRWMGQTVGSGYDKGRGMLQLTRVDNYRDFSSYMKRKGKYPVTDFMDANKELLEQEPYASLSAAWYWAIHKRLNVDADENDFIKVVFGINTGFNGYDERLKFLRATFKEFDLPFEDYVFEKSVVFDDARGSLGWGLWHDPGLTSRHFNDCTNNVNEAIKGYRRFLKLPKQEFSKHGDWFELGSLNEAKGVPFDANEAKSVTFAKYRLNQLGA